MNNKVIPMVMLMVIIAVSLGGNIWHTLNDHSQSLSIEINKILLEKYVSQAH